MDKLRAIQLLIRLSELGSFTKVAEEFSASKSMISKEISRLEAMIGARLIHRSTRNIQFTQIGEGYLRRCREALLAIDDAEAFVQDMQRQPKGKLKINAPMALGITELGGPFADFMQAYPELELDIHLGDEFIDLVEQGFDLGFRASSQTFDSNYVGKPLTNFSYRVCASAEYLHRHPPINNPIDLQQHNCFVYSYFPTRNRWPLDGGIAIQGKLKVNSTVFMLEVIKRGLGIGFLPDFVCSDALNRQEVVEILPAATRPLLTLYALYPDRHFIPPKLIVCIEYLANWFKQRAELRASQS